MFLPPMPVHARWTLARRNQSYKESQTGHRCSKVKISKYNKCGKKKWNTKHWLKMEAQTPSNSGCDDQYLGPSLPSVDSLDRSGPATSSVSSIDRLKVIPAAGEIRSNMASALATYVTTLCIVLCICNSQISTVVATYHQHERVETLEFVVFTHEIRGGPNATLLAAAGTGQGDFSALGWGSFVTIDNLLMQGPTFTSKLIGKYTGFATLTTKGGFADGGILAVSQFRFGTGSKYPGSSLTVIGNLVNPPQGPWPMTIVGGSGHFLGFSGYAVSTPFLATTVAPRFVFKWVVHLSKGSAH